MKGARGRSFKRCKADTFCLVQTSAVEKVRCSWCGGMLPSQSGSGRRRRYCGQSCRQRSYEQRALSVRAGLPAEAIVVTRAEVDHLQDRLFALRCALSDAGEVLADTATAGELRAALAQVSASVGELDRLWVTPRD